MNLGPAPPLAADRAPLCAPSAPPPPLLPAGSFEPACGKVEANTLLWGKKAYGPDSDIYTEEIKDVTSMDACCQECKDVVSACKGGAGEGHHGRCACLLPLAGLRRRAGARLLRAPAPSDRTRLARPTPTACLPPQAACSAYSWDKKGSTCYLRGPNGWERRRKRGVQSARLVDPDARKPGRY